MADKQLTELDVTVTPAGTDLFGVRQSGDLEDKSQTRAQVHNLETGEHLILASVDEVATPTLGFGDGDSGFYEPTDDTLAMALAGVDGFRYVGAAGHVLAQSEIHAGLTASITQTQGNGALLSSYNEVAVVGSDDDTVTLPPAVAGRTVFVANNAGNELQVFPASGDSLNPLGTVDQSARVDEFFARMWVASTDAKWHMPAPAQLDGTATDGPRISDFSALANSPTLIPSRSDLNTGIGWAGIDILTLVAGSQEMLRLIETADPLTHQLIISSQLIIGAAATPALAFGDGDTGWFEDADDSLNRTIGGTIQQVTGINGKLFINTLTGVLATGSNIVTATPANIEIFAAGTTTNLVNGGAIELWGGYANNQDARGGHVILWGGGAGGGPSVGGDVKLFGGEADVTPGDVELTGGVATVGGDGGDVNISGGAGFGAGARDGGGILMIGGAGVDTGNGGATAIRAGAAGPTGAGGILALQGGASTTGAAGALTLVGGSAVTNGVGGAITIDGGAAGSSAGNNSGGAVSITGGLSNGTSAGAAVNIAGGAVDPGQAANGGAVNIDGADSGTGATGNGGAVLIESGDALSTNGAGGAAQLKTGDGTGTGNGGLTTVSAGNSGAGATGNGGGINILSGQALSTNGDGGLIQLISGAGVGSGFAGDIILRVGPIEALRFEMGSSGTSILQTVDARANLTADAGSSQGDGVIPNSYNVYSVVGTAGDAATLPDTFAVGMLIYVKNDDSTESMDVFPALGDDAGAGTNVAVAVAAGDFAVFMATAINSTWTKIMGGTA